jgi:hypothetical protein
MRPVIDDAQRRSVERFLEAVIRDACHMADMTAAFLKDRGWRPSRKKADSHGVLPELNPTMSRAHGVLLNLAAALRIASWERAGLRSELSADLPSSTEAIQRLVPPESPDSSESAPVVPELSAQVFRTWLERFSRSSRATLGTDIVLPTNAVSEDELLDALADFLFENRHLADVREEQR